MDARVSKFREHLRRMASGSLPSYAECVGRGLRRQRMAPRFPARTHASWVTLVPN